MKVSMHLADGVLLVGNYERESRGDRWTPGVPGFVDPGSLNVEGRPDKVAEFLAGYSDEWTADVLQGLAERLSDHVEEVLDAD